MVHERRANVTSDATQVTHNNEVLCEHGVEVEQGGNKLVRARSPEGGKSLFGSGLKVDQTCVFDVKYWGCWDSNPEPKDYESSALTVELQPLVRFCGTKRF